jgi:predicted RNA-binding Zn-ribbon protein involved in translation (DUF1610 family)
MSDQPKIIQGEKIDPEEQKTLDPTKMGVMLTGTPAAEVEGQFRYWAYTQCPWCGNVGRSLISTERYNWYTCGSCGGAFRA